MKFKILLSSALLLGLVGAACTEQGADSPVNPSAAAVTPENETALPRQRRPQPSRDELVIRNCLLVRDAAEAWAAESGGAYPADPESRNTSGHTLVDFLPGGTYLVNPFDGQRDEPKYLCHGHPGETDYLYYDGYGCGECGLDDCGHDGYIVDLLPCGILLPNSYLCVRIEPRDGQAVNPGEIGYVVTMQDAHCTGYWITGYGRRGIVIVLGKNPSDHEAPMNYKLRPHAL